MLWMSVPILLFTQAFIFVNMSTSSLSELEHLFFFFVCLICERSAPFSKLACDLNSINLVTQAFLLWGILAVLEQGTLRGCKVAVCHPNPSVRINTVQFILNISHTSYYLLSGAEHLHLCPWAVGCPFNPKVVDAHLLQLLNTTIVVDI